MEDLLEPRKKYLTILEKEHKENVTTYFDELAKKANIDEAGNKLTCDKIYALDKEISELNRLIKKARKNWLVTTLFLLFFVALFLGFMLIPLKAVAGYIISFIASIAFLVLAIIVSKKGKKAAGKIEEIKKPKVEKREVLLKEAYAQMAPLNSLYEWDTYTKLMNKTTPLIEMDARPDMKKVQALEDKFKWKDGNNVNTSTLVVQTGSILGNPFIFYRHKDMEMVQHTYTGSLTITWTERVKTKDGWTTVTRTQVLTASVVKPLPTYYSTTELVYGNEAAPDLSFSRHPMIKNYTEKGLNSFFKQREKEIDSYAKKHPNFTPFGNDRFEDYFDGVNRDNEVQYRLLFTPLAQKSMIDLITNKEPFGDDFYFVKQKMINKIISSHSQGMSYDTNVSDFYHFDYQVAKANFINKNMTFFKNVFFDLAPLLAIPLYQQYPTNEYIFKRDVPYNFSRHVSEMEANRHQKGFFAPENLATDLILKSEFIRRDGSADILNIHSYGFRSIRHLDFITKLGGDGKFHQVPVEWYEYLPVDKLTPFTVQGSEISRQEYLALQQSGDYEQFLNKNVLNNDIICDKGIFSFVGKDSRSYNSLELNETIKKNLTNHSDK